jgi:hypothetical protein
MENKAGNMTHGMLGEQQNIKEEIPDNGIFNKQM